MFVLLILVVLVGLALQSYSLRNASDHRKIRYECKPSVRCCEPGEEFIVYSTVQNLGRRSSPLLRIEERFPIVLEVREAKQFNVKILLNNYRIYRSAVVVRRKQQVKRYLRASISTRGEHVFSNADFWAGDYLGLKEFYYRMNNDQRIVIYPPLLGDSAFLRAFINSLEEIAKERQLLEDPMSVCGYLDYTGREPMRNISWKQSAVRNSLVVKQFDPAWQESVCIVLDMEYHGEFDLHYPRQEICFSIARTVCDNLERRNISYRLVTNAIITNTISSFSSAGGMGGSYSKILYALGAAKNGEICSVGELIRTVCSGANRQRFLVFISTRECEESIGAIRRAKALTGGKIIPLYADAILPSPPDENENDEGSEEA